MYFCSFCFFFRSPLHHVQHNSPSIFQYAYSIFILIIVVVAVLYYCLLMLYISCYFYNLTHKRCCLKLYFCNSSCCLFLSLINKSIVSNSGRYFLLNFFLSTLFCYNFSFKLAFIQASGKRTK